MAADRTSTDLKQMVDAVEIRSPTCYVLLGEYRDFSGNGMAPDTVGYAPGSAQPEVPVADGEPQAMLLPMLEAELYSRLYTRPSGNGFQPSSPFGVREHLSALSAANTGHGTWEPGWEIVECEADGRVAVTKDGVTFWVNPDGLRTVAGRPRPGSFCRIRIGKELRQLVPGFYLAIGDGNEQERRDTTDVRVRLYWHLTVDAAVPYVAQVTTMLNRAGIPFRTKVVSDPRGYTRADAGVLYLERRYFRAACPIIREIYRVVKPGLRPQVPMFTKPIAPGLGLAEDPNNGLSFGQSRCRVVASALWTCYVRGIGEPESRLAVVEDAFRREGIDPESPFLLRGSRDRYALSI